MLPNTGAVTVNGGALALGTANESIGTLSGSGGVIELSNGVGRTLTVNQSVEGTYSGIIQGSGGVLIKNGTALLRLNGSNTHTGGTTISAGTLQLGNSGTVLADTGAVTVNGGTLALGTANEMIGTLSGSGGAIELSNGTGRTLTVNQSVDGTYLGGVQGSGGVLVKNGSALLRLSGANTHTGGTVLNDGILAIGSDNALSTGPVTINGGNIRASGAARTISNSVTLNGDFTLGRSTNFSGPMALTNNITITSANPDTSTPSTSTLSGVISGNHSLTFTTGTNPIGTIVLSGTNTYTGGTTVTAGTVRLGNSGTVLADTGAVTVNGGTLALGTANETIGTLAGAGGTINLFNNAGRTLTVNQTASNTFSGAIQGTGGSLVKTGSATLILGGNNSYTGGTTIQNGMLRAAGNHALGTGTVKIAGGILLLDTGVQLSNSIVLSGGSYQRSISGNLTNAVNATSDLLASFSTTSSALNDEMRFSDVYSFAGTGSSAFLELSFASTVPDAYLGWLSGDEWVNARDGNTGNNPLYAAQFAGSFADFQAQHGSDLNSYMGAWGVDKQAGVTSVWGVLNHNSEYSIVPEPSAWILVACGILGMLVRREACGSRRK